MLYRLLLIVSIALALAACIGEDDYELSTQGEVEVLPEPEIPPDPSIVPNGVGYLEGEDVGADAPAGWAITINDGIAFAEVSDAQYHDGAKSLKVTITTPGANPWDIEVGPTGIDVSELAAGYTFVFTGWVLGTPGAIANFTASLPVDPWTTFGNQRVEVANYWKKAEFEFSVPEGTTEIRLPIQLSQPENENVELYIDGISLIAVSKEAEPFRPLPVDAGWRVSDDTTNLTYNENGVVYSPNSGSDQLVFDFVGPETYQDKTFTFEIIPDQAFIDSGASIQPFGQVKVGSWPGHWGCWIDNGNLSAEGITYSCKMQGDADAQANRIFDLADGEGLQVGIQAVNGPPAGTVTIASWSVDLPPLSDIDLTADWSVSSGLEAVYDATGVSYSPTAIDHQLVYLLDGPDNLEGAVITYSISVTQEYIASGASLQPFAQNNFDPWAGVWGCWIENGNLSTEPTSYSCTLDGSGAPFNLVDGQGVNVGVKAVGVVPAGSVTIHNVDIEYPSVAVDAGWRTGGTSEISYAGGVTYSPTTNSEILVFDVSGPKNLMGTQYVFNIVASQEYIDSGAALQPFYQPTYGDWSGGNWGWVNNSDLSTSGYEVTLTLASDEEKLNLEAGESMQIGIQTNGTPAGTITITNVDIIYGD